MRRHGCAQGFRRGALAGARLEHDQQPRDVLAGFRRRRIQPRAGATDTVNQGDVRILRILLLQFSDKLVRVDQRGARRLFHRHLEAALRQRRNQIHAERRNQRDARSECKRGKPKHRKRMRKRLGQEPMISACGSVVRHHHKTPDHAQHFADRLADHTKHHVDDHSNEAWNPLEKRLRYR